MIKPMTRFEEHDAPRPQRRKLQALTLLFPSANPAKNEITRSLPAYFPHPKSEPPRQAAPRRLLRRCPVSRGESEQPLRPFPAGLAKRRMCHLFWSCGSLFIS